MGNAGVLFNPVVLSEIVLPNGQSYTFNYDIFGAIEKVVLPTGGYQKFEYTYTGGISSPINFQFVYAQGNRGVTRHVVSPTGIAADEVQWLYGGSGNFATMTAPDGSRTERYLWTDGVSGWGYSADSSRTGQPYDERLYSASGQMIRRKLTDWAMTPSNATGNPSGTQVANRNARIVRELEINLDTSGGPALAKSKTYSYDTTYQYTVGVERTAVNEFDYQPLDQNTAQTLPIDQLSTIPNGTLLRTTETDFLTNDANYRSRNLLGLVTATRVKDGAGTVVAQSSNSYDESSFPLLTYSSVVDWTDPATTYRGNVTTVSSWLNFNGSTLSSFPQGTYLSTHMQYDQCGSVRKSWDPKDTSLLNPAQIEYSSTYQFAYPTTQTSPDPDGNGPLTSLVTSTEYDFSTGLVTATVDANAQRTTFAYNDPLNRLKQIVRAATDAPTQNQTTYNYDDLAHTVTTTSDLTTYNDNVLKTATIYDGLGRVVETRRYIGGASYISVQQQYDAIGRVIKISNPFIPAQGETVLWTTQQYDALGRVLSVTTPDSAVMTTSYSGNTMTVTDQTGKQRKSVMDPSARLIQVIEAPNDPNYNFFTDYQYDALGNLVKVTQGSQARYFMFDSLKRLIRSRNVEQGTNPNLNITDPLTLNANWSAGYQYDNNNNLAQRTDTRGVGTIYAYDSLNRNTSISYSNDPTGTPSVTHVYDTATNGKGRLSQSQTTGLSLITIDSYDAMGRPMVQRQQFYANGAWGQPYITQRGYNLAGGIISQIYPSNHVANYSYDGTGRLNSFSGTIGDGNSRTYSNEIIYSPFGGLAKEKFGTTTPIYNKLFYNSRGQLSEIRESTSYTGPTDTNWNRGAIINHYSDQCWGMCTPTSAMTDNNGNLKKQDVYIPNDDQISSYAMREQQFSYDSLNRLSSAREILESGAEQWKQQFAYDHWGNRTVNTGVTYGIPEKDFTVDTTNNRLGVPVGQSAAMTYDLAGNLTSDTYTGAGNRTYDAENRIVSAWGGNNQAQLYSYDAEGHRIKRNVNGVESWQIYGFDSELLAEYAAGAVPATPQKEYGYRNGQLLVTADAGSAINGYSFRRTITIDHTKVPNTDQANFPVLIKGTYAYLATVSNGGNVQNANGYDVLFTSDAGCNTKLDHEVESYSAATGAVNYWVRVPSVSHTTDTTIYLCYGKSSITTDQSNKAGVWDSNFKGVWHLGGTSSVNATDSTANANNGTAVNSPTVQTGMIGSGAGLTAASSQYVLMGNVLDISTGDFTLEAWINPTNIDQFVSIMGKRDANPPNYPAYAFGLGYLTSTSANIPGKRVSLFTYQGGALAAPNAQSYRTTNDVVNGNWHHVVASRASGVVTLYVDGSAAATTAEVPNTTAPNSSNTHPFGLGHIDGLGYFDGLLDEARVSFSARSSDWIAAEYNNQNSPSTFYTVSTATSSQSGKAQWLITDQLGTPRMIFDESGSLVNVKRHDYLPFGEELTTVSGRTPAQGYAPDGLRQQFTAKERDAETGLDYFGARYYASVQGRFISPDPIFGSSRAASPQSWNRYSFCINTPLVLRDLKGLDWGVTIVTDAQGSFRRYQWFNGKIGIGRDGRRYTPVNFGAQGFLDVPTQDGQIVRIQNRGIIRQVVYSGPGGDGPARSSGSSLNMTAGFVDGTVPFGKQIREAVFGKMGVDTSSAEYENASTISSGVSIGIQFLTGSGEAEAGLKLASRAGGESAEMSVVRVIERGEKLDSIINEAKVLTFQTGNEHALVTLASGERALVSGGPGGINFAEGSITRIFGHTHPYGTALVGPSAADRAAIEALGQKSSWLVEGGSVGKFTPH